MSSPQAPATLDMACRCASQAIEDVADGTISPDEAAAIARRLELTVQMAKREAEEAIAAIERA